MREFALFFCVVVGLCVGMWAGHEYGRALEREQVAQECRSAGAFTLRQTGFKCEPIKKSKRYIYEQ